MDQHPIPQNVTGFQFKLIGSMTVKQFGYVAVGVIAAVIIYYLPIKGLVGVLLKILLIPLFGASGAIIAFIPVDGRPIDVMAGNFFKALFSPNQYIYRKNLNRFSFSTIAPAKTGLVSKQAQKHNTATPSQQAISNKSKDLRELLSKSNEHKIKNAQDQREETFLKNFSQLPAMPTSTSPALTTSPLKPHATPNPLPIPKPPVVKETPPEVLSEKEAALKKQLDFAKKEEATQHDPKEIALLHQKTLELEKQVQETHTQKQALEQEIQNLKSQLIIQKTAVPTITQATKVQDPAPQIAAAAHVRSVPKEMNKKMGFLVSDTPNVVSGVVKDPRGNVLPNILVEIKDKADNPVRAFKTNALGNFASATPLPNGTYTITLEDPRKLNTFDEIKITTDGQVILPIEIISYDKREELRKDLFS